MGFNGEGVLGLWLELIEGNDMAGLRGGGDRVGFELGGSLKFKGSDEVVGGREGNNDLIGSERGDEGLGENLVCGDTGVLRKRKIVNSKRNDANS